MRMDPKLGVVKGDGAVAGKPTAEDVRSAEEILAEMRKLNRSISFSDWTTAIVVVGGFVLPLAIVLWRWALS